MSVTVGSSGGGFVQVTHMGARCCSGSWACSLSAKHSFSTDPYQQSSGPSKEMVDKKQIDNRWDALHIQNLVQHKSNLLLGRMHNQRIFSPVTNTSMVILVNALNDSYF